MRALGSAAVSTSFLADVDLCGILGGELHGGAGVGGGDDGGRPATSRPLPNPRDELSYLPLLVSEPEDVETNSVHRLLLLLRLLFLEEHNELEEFVYSKDDVSPILHLFWLVLLLLSPHPGALSKTIFADMILEQPLLQWFVVLLPSQGQPEEDTILRSARKATRESAMILRFLLYGWPVP